MKFSQYCFSAMVLSLLGLCACTSLGKLSNPKNAPVNNDRAVPVTAPEADIAHSCSPDQSASDGWNTATSPFHLYGNTWYVGTCGISVVLVSSPHGHVLIDGATAEAAPLIEANIRALGFKVEDIKAILVSHEHRDHAGGVAQLQRDSGAQVYAGLAAVTTLQRGKNDRSDPQFLDSSKFPPIASVIPVEDKQIIRVGSLQITAVATPGHTPGGTSWMWPTCQGDQCINIVYSDSLTALTDAEYRYSDESKHPGAINQFRASIDKIALSYCPLLLTTHPSASDFWNRIGPQAKATLINHQACKILAANAHKGLDAVILKEQSGMNP